MKKLGNLLLPDSLQWTDRYSWSPVAMETERTLVGTLVSWSQTLTGGRPVTLLAEDGETWLTQDNVKTIQSMASQAGATFVLIWDEEAMTVQFRHNEPPASSFQPIWPNHGMFVGTMKLMMV